MSGTILGSGIQPAPEHKVVEFADFLSDAPLNSTRMILNAWNPQHSSVIWPEAYQDFCLICDGRRRHKLISSGHFRHYRFGSFICADCESKAGRSFGIEILDIAIGDRSIVCKKVFQSPDFGAPIPKNLFELIGEENRPHFLNARRSIARGLGIGAFTYYRRIIENGKLSLVDAVHKVATAIGSPTAQIELLRQAANERQFSRAIDLLKDANAIPPMLLINGHNPLLLLHDELSEGVHAMSDEECLERARHAEVILYELARLLRLAVTERKGVADSLRAILNRKKGDAAASADF